MRYWVFVIRDDESVFNKRIENKKWPIFHSTKFRTFLEIGDKIVFYKAGEHGQIFLGTAILKTKGLEIPDKMMFYVDLEAIDIWTKSPSIRNQIKNLSFIKNKEHWGLNLQGGILKMKKNDYFLILEEAKKLEQKK